MQEAARHAARGSVVSRLEAVGWEVLPFDAVVLRWAEAAHRAAMAVVAEPAERDRWLRHDATWFVGVDVLPNAPDGSIDGVPLDGRWRARVDWPGPWHRAQLSVVYPGYPGRDPGESDAAHAFRRDRDAAHLDGLLALGPAKRRYLREPHGFIAGLPLNAVAPGASPLVVWEGSAPIIRAAMGRVFAGIAPQDLADCDVTNAYQAARREVFDTCPRRVIHAAPGQVVLMHRMAVHGVAPWQEGAEAPAEGRMVAYFRPILDDPAVWLLPG